MWRHENKNKVLEKYYYVCYKKKEISIFYFKRDKIGYES